MAYYLYSPEPFPAKRKRNSAYQDAVEYIEYNGFRMAGPIPANEWLKVPRHFSRLEFESYMDHRGSKVVMLDDEWAEAIKALFGPRGVIVVEDSELLGNKEQLEEESKQINLEFRKAAIEEFERNLSERKVTGKGRPYPTSYEEECYEVLGLTKPYSVDALKAERDPGEAAAQKIADAIATALNEGRRKQDELAGVAPATGTAADFATDTVVTTARS